MQPQIMNLLHKPEFMQVPCNSFQQTETILFIVIVIIDIYDYRTCHTHHKENQI